MPLIHSSSKSALKTNIRNLMGEVGKSPHVQSREQALAIAFETKRRSKRAAGGPTSWQSHPSAMGGPHHTGPIISAVPGRTDRHNMHVPSGSYVIPSETISHLGQNNTLAGMKIANNMFGPAGPYGAVRGMRMPGGIGVPRSEGGARGRGTGMPTPIVAAGGEFVVTPDVVAAIGGGDLKRGHDILDKWVMSLRKDHIKTLRKLPPPVKT